jgi:tetratricopeptide (TPR) repeat protein
MNTETLPVARRAGLGTVLAWTVIAALTAGRARGADAPPAVRLRATAVGGAPIAVPDAAHPTVLLFILAGQPQGAQAITDLADAVGKTPDVRVVTVVDGADAAGLARQLATDKHPWPIVLDADHTLSGNLGVHAWPTTVIVSPAGARVGHVAGQPKTYARKVEAYVDLAAGRIDRAALERRLASHDAVLDSPEQMAERHVQVASRLLQKGLVEQSRAELARAVALRPKDPAIQAELADLLLSAGDAASAAAVLDQIAPSAAAATGTRTKVLRGKLLIASGKWDEAKALLMSAVQLNPDPAEALYQLGLCYQHDGDWPRAADAFRRAYEHAPGRRGGTGAK